MSDGVTVGLSELIALQRYAQTVHTHHKERGSARSGLHLSRTRGRGMDFSEVRNYQAGDEIRHVEWRVTARTGRPYVKLYQEEREKPMVLLVDFNPSMFFGTRHAFKSVVAARLAALLAWTALKQGDRVGGLLYSGATHNEFTAQRSHQGVMPFLAALSDYSKSFDPNQPSKSTPLGPALLRLRRVTRPGSTIILISDFYHTDEMEKHLSRLADHNDILFYHVCDPLEIAPPKPQHYAITDGTQEMWLDMRNKSLQTAYQQMCDNHLQTTQALCKRYGIPYIQVMTYTDVVRLVHRTFPRRNNGSRS